MTPSPHDDDHDGGLAFDVPTLSRRRALTLMGGAGLLALVGCASSGGDSATAITVAGATATTAAGASTSTSVASGSEAACSTIPEETGGPFPGDGSNGPDALTESGIVRSDITSSFGSAGSDIAEGVPLTLQLTVLDNASGCAPLEGAAVYVWHCNRDGQYSMYDQEIAEQNYLRGVQETGADGVVIFTSIFPAAYSGRWPHIHFEVYASVDDATSGGAKLATSQLAMPQDACDIVFASSGYEASAGNLAQTSLDTDMVFSDGYSQQLAAVTGTVADGFTAQLTVPV